MLWFKFFFGLKFFKPVWFLQSKPKKRERQKLFLECLLFYDQSDSRRNRNKPQQ